MHTIYCCWSVKQKDGREGTLALRSGQSSRREMRNPKERNCGWPSRELRRRLKTIRKPSASCCRPSMVLWRSDLAICWCPGWLMMTATGEAHRKEAVPPCAADCEAATDDDGSTHSGPAPPNGPRGWQWLKAGGSQPVLLPIVHSLGLQNSTFHTVAAAVVAE